MAVTAFRLSRSPALAFAAMGAMWGAFAALVPELKGRLAAGDAEFGAALLFSAFGLVLSMWLAPVVAGKLGMRALSLSMAALAGAFLLPALAPGLPLLAAAMLALGMISGLTDILANARVSEIEAHSGRALMNLNHGLFSAAYAAAAVATGAAREVGAEPVTVFAVLAAVTIAATPGMRSEWCAEPSVPDPAPQGGNGRIVVWIGLILLVAFFAENAAEAWSALHVERTLGGRAAEGALGPAMLGATMAVGRFSGQVVASRLPEIVVLKWAALLSAAGAALAALAPVILGAYLGFALLGLGLSVLAPLALALVGRRVAAAARTRAIARVSAIGFLGYLVAPLLMGVVSELGGLRLSFLAVAGLLLLIPVMLVPLRRDGARG